MSLDNVVKFPTRVPFAEGWPTAEDSHAITKAAKGLHRRYGARLMHDEEGGRSIVIGRTEGADVSAMHYLLGPSQDGRSLVLGAYDEAPWPTYRETIFGTLSEALDAMREDFRDR